MTEIIINGRKIEAEPGQLLVDTCRNNGIHVPTYCYHPGLTPVGSCRMCQVELKQGEMPPRLVAACRTPVGDGMVVETEAENAQEARRTCLEFLLKDHPLDCPICDKAGECDLQDFAFAEGQSEGRSVEPRRKLAKRKSFGDVILFDQERCILCSRCVRFFEDVDEKPQRTVAGLGDQDHDLHGVTSFKGNYQGNFADICPVGALTIKEFRFQARVWNLSKHASTCGECSRGCSISVQVLRGTDVKRIRPRYNPQVNEWWMCDHGRFSFDRFAKPGRVEGALERGPQGFEPIEPRAALEKLADVLGIHPEPAIVVSPWLTVEEGGKVLELAQILGVTAACLAPAELDVGDELLRTAQPSPNLRGLTEAGLETVTAEEVGERLGAAAASLLIGERIAECVGAEALGALPAAHRLVLFDTHVLDVPACRTCVGVPDSVERAGTWVNVDGHRGPIGAARSAPPGVASLVGILDKLIRLVTPTEVTAR